MPTNFPGDGLGQIVPIFIGVVFVIVIGGILFRVITGVTEWNQNNSEPVLTAPARIVAKREKVRRHHHHHHGHEDHHHHHSRASTSYFATFELEGGERMEFQLGDREFGLLAEGDSGELTYQGTRYHGFRRRCDMFA
jgi:hypothetical protein